MRARTPAARHQPAKLRRPKPPRSLCPPRIASNGEGQRAPQCSPHAAVSSLGLARRCGLTHTLTLPPGQLPACRSTLEAATLGTARLSSCCRDSRAWVVEKVSLPDGRVL